MSVRYIYRDGACLVWAAALACDVWCGMWKKGTRHEGHASGQEGHASGQWQWRYRPEGRASKTEWRAGAGAVLVLELWRANKGLFTSYSLEGQLGIQHDESD